MWERLPSSVLESTIDLTRDGLASSNGQEISSLACVCRRWAEIVLGILWRDGDFARLLGTLPEDLLACLIRSTSVDVSLG